MTLTAPSRACQDEAGAETFMPGRPHRWFGWALAVAVMLAPAAGRADAIADFFKGKVVRLVVAYPPGGGYDVYARALAQVLPKHLPGSPAVIVQYMPGAGSLTASNWLYAAAEKDGTVVLSPSNAAAFAPLQSVDGAKFD